MVKNERLIKILENELNTQEVKLRALPFNMAMQYEVRVAKAREIEKNIRQIKRELASLCR